MAWRRAVGATGGNWNVGADIVIRPHQALVDQQVANERGNAPSHRLCHDVWVHNVACHVACRSNQDPCDEPVRRQPER